MTRVASQFDTRRRRGRLSRRGGDGARAPSQVDRDKENWGLMIGLIAFMCGSTFLLLVLSHKYSMFGNLQIKRVLSLGDIGL
mmetsp:Transcript_11595/g.35746  ORF Transcript_11595/g.35746 Transcript_11595/m.35746 type:complete len:82 (+) Transcript_11595:617-862(+)